MPLVDVDFPEPAEALPRRMRALVTEGERRIRAFIDARGGAVAGFVPSDFERVGQVLRAVVHQDLAPGRAFCEWGSGFGVVTLLAAQLEFSACGIEVDPELVEHAERLAADFEMDVEFACGTFVPHGGEDLTDVPQEFAWLLTGAACGHEELRVDPADFDLIFAYPWPGEEQVVEDLFERFAATSALLLTYHGMEDIRLRRKVTG